MSATAKAMVLTAFGQPLELREFPWPALEPGAVLARVTAAGICGSDLDIASGHDPRVHLPMILGHEGVGVIADLGGSKRDLFGQELAVGDAIVWHRAVTCGRCVYCAVKKQPSLCLTRKVYGISLPCDEPPHLNGCYADHLYVRPESEIIKLPAVARGAGVPPAASTRGIAGETPAPRGAAALVSATCSGATAAHAVDLANIHPGDTVAVMGPGPLGIYAAAFAFDRGASQVVMLGTGRSPQRLQLAESFGCVPVNISETTEGRRRELLADLTHGLGADSVLDCAGTAASVREAIGLCARGGTVTIPGVAVPIGEIPLRPYEDLAVRNVNLQGVWVSDARHLWEALSLAQSGKYPLDQLVTHTFPLARANEALEALRSRQAMKVVLTGDDPV